MEKTNQNGGGRAVERERGIRGDRDGEGGKRERECVCVTQRQIN